MLVKTSNSFYEITNRCSYMQSILFHNIFYFIEYIMMHGTSNSLW